MKNNVYYVAFEEGRCVRYITGGDHNFPLSDAGHWALPMSCRKADNLAEALLAQGKKAFVIKAIRPLDLRNPDKGCS